jgi:hypothetical protein
MVVGVDELIKQFEATDQTVRDFNNIFINSPITYPYPSNFEVEICGIYPAGRLLVVNGDKIFQELKPIKIGKRKTKGKFKKEYVKKRDNFTINEGSKVFSNIALKLQPTEFKLLCYFKTSKTRVYTLASISKDLNLTARTLNTVLPKMEKKNIIKVERLPSLPRKITVNEESVWKSLF